MIASWRARPMSANNCRLAAPMTLGLKLLSVGAEIAARIPRIAITTSNSSNVKALSFRGQTGISEPHPPEPAGGAGEAVFLALETVVFTLILPA